MVSNLDKTKGKGGNEILSFTTSSRGLGGKNYFRLEVQQLMDKEK